MPATGCAALLCSTRPPFHIASDALQADAEAATSIAATQAARAAARDRQPDRQRGEQTRDAADFAGGELRFYGRPMEVVLRP